MSLTIRDIDTRQGTNSTYRLSHGNTLPLTGVPFGMNYWAVQNNAADGGWYFNPTSHVFQGYRLTHQPSPWIGDFQHLTILPYKVPLSENFVDITGSFLPQDAYFNPTELKLLDRNSYIESNLVPTTYGAIIDAHQVDESPIGFMLSLPGTFELQLDEKLDSLTGFISNFADSRDPDFKMYVSLTFNQKINRKNIQLFDEHNKQLSVTTSGKFDGTDCSLRLPLTVSSASLRVATSFISSEQAQLNLTRFKNQDLDELRELAVAAWQKYFDRIEVSDNHVDRVRTFYTMLYREFLFPTRFYELDHNNQIIHFDTTARTVKPGYLFTNNGFWDTYKTVYPFFSIVAPELLPVMLEGFLNSYRESGFLPKWLSPDERGMMPGTMIDAVIADSISKGIGLEHAEELLSAMIKSATTEADDKRYGRTGVLDYIKYGYVPDKYCESVNLTLDYSYSDYAISVVAEKLGKTDIANKYRKSSLSYRNLFNSKSGFLETKDISGQFTDKNFSPIKWGHGYTEGAAWQNSFNTYHDFQGYKKLLGNGEEFYDKLAELVNTEPKFDVGSYGFEIHEMTEMSALNFGQLAMSNQPSFHIPYLFTHLNHPEITQLLVKQLLTTAFNSGMNGFPGDEDNGSMAGWYLFSALGFYPVTPGSTQFVLGIPLFEQVTIKLPNNQKLKISTKNNLDHNLFVTNLKLNKQLYDRSYLTYEQIMSGGSLEFSLGLAPKYKKYSPDNLPFSITE